MARVKTVEKRKQNQYSMEKNIRTRTSIEVQKKQHDKEVQKRMLNEQKTLGRNYSVPGTNRDRKALDYYYRVTRTKMTEKQEQNFRERRGQRINFK